MGIVGSIPFYDVGGNVASPGQRYAAPDRLRGVEACMRPRRASSVTQGVLTSDGDPLVPSTSTPMPRDLHQRQERQKLTKA